MRPLSMGRARRYGRRNDPGPRRTREHALLQQPAHHLRGRVRRAAPARLLPTPPVALRRARDRRGPPRRPVRARDRTRRSSRPGRGAPGPRLRALPGRPRDRVRQAARPGAAAHGPRLRALLRGRARRLARPQGGRPGRHAAARGDHPLRDLARGARAGPQGRGRDLLEVRAADHLGRLDRGLRGDHPALDLLLGQGRHGLDAAAAGRAVRARRDRVPRRARRGAFHAHPSGPAAPAGHHRPDPGARGARALRRLRRAGGVTRPRGHPRRVHRRRDPLARRPRRGHDSPGLPPQARGRGLRLLHPRLLRDEWRALRPRRADRLRLERPDGPGVPRRAAGRARAAGDRLPARARRPPRRDRGDHAGDLAALHRRGDRDRAEPPPHRRSRERGADRRGAALRPALPAHRARAAATGRRAAQAARRRARAAHGDVAVREHTAACGRSWSAEAAGTTVLVAAILLAAAATRDAGAARFLALGALVAPVVAAVALSPLGRRSGAHLNPAVTLGFWARGRLGRRDAAGYVAAQAFGAAAGAWLAAAALPASALDAIGGGGPPPGRPPPAPPAGALDAIGGAATHPAVPPLAALGLEAAMTAVLLAAVFAGWRPLM